MLNISHMNIGRTGAAFDTSPERRITERKPISAQAAIRWPDGKLSVQILDLSISGCRIQMDRNLYVQSRITIILPGLESKAAKVTWRNDVEMGCQFETPLHPAVLIHLAQKFLS